MSKKIEIISKPFKGIRIPHWPIFEMCGYEPKTTFWQDFWIAIYFGKDAVQDTYDRAFNEWKSDPVYITEMVLVLNHLIWVLHEKNESMARLFDRLWRELSQWCEENLKESDLEYHWRTTD